MNLPLFSDVPAGALIDALNPEQRAAVTLPAEHALILAGAGSGKTRVLTTRIAWLLSQGHVSPAGLLAVTFTNKAAKEMLTRLTAMLPVNTRGMWIGTFHGLCNRLLRAHYQAARLPQSFQILDTQDQTSALKRLCKQYNIDDERYPAKQLGWFIAACKEDGLRPSMVVARDPETRKKVEIYQLYEDQCQREGVVDFGELLLRSYELLRDHDPIRAHYQRRFRHILVDEFQDTNKLQYAWLKLLAGHSEPEGRVVDAGAVLAVGDDDQSIYAFRGARVGNMGDFVREFGVMHQIKLEQNYRSYSHILDCANELISHNSKRLGKNLRTDQGAGEPVRVVACPNDFEEARWVVDEVRQLVREGVPRHEIAVLYRSNAQSRVVETSLFNAGIPYRVYGGQRFFERAEIKHALAYLRLLDNPNDDTSFLRVVNFPARGIGARSIEQLQDVARGAGSSLHDAVSTLSGRAGTAVATFVAKLDVMREHTARHKLSDIVRAVLEHSGLQEHYRNDKEGEDRLENLEELVNAAESFVLQEGFGREAPGMQAASMAAQGAAPGVASGGGPLAEGAAGDGLEPTGETLSPLAAFLTHAALEAGDNMAQAGQDAVQLMTVHASKGLEFDCVFITGLEEGLFPHENAASDREGLEEERRLMYVAITRARKRLFLTHAQMRMLHGQTRYNPSSRFLDELPEACLKWLSPRHGAAMAPQAARSANAYGATFSGASSAYSTRAGVQFNTPKTVETAATATSDALKVGCQVFHNKFGEGKVLTLEGNGADARAQIHFPRHGTKWLALSVAKLTVV
ncbi:MAG: UvrD-helicase domain-containing protein [Rhodoferax sp.]